MKKGSLYWDILSKHPSYINSHNENAEMLNAYYFLHYELVSTGNEIAYYFEDSCNMHGWLTTNEACYIDHIANNSCCTSLVEKKKNSLNSVEGKYTFEVLINDLKNYSYKEMNNFKKIKTKSIQKNKLFDFEKNWERIPLEFVISLSCSELQWFMETLEYLDKYEKIFVSNRVYAIDLNFIHYLSKLDRNPSVGFSMDQEMKEDLKMIKEIVSKSIPDSIFEHFYDVEVDNLQTKLGELFLFKSLLTRTKLELKEAKKEYEKFKKIDK